MYQAYANDEPQLISSLYPEHNTPNVTTRLHIMTEETTRTDVYNIVKPIEEDNMYRLRPADFIYWV